MHPLVTTPPQSNYMCDQVQVFSSDPDENPPFLLKIDDDKKAELAFEINKEIVQVEGERNIVRIDKDVFGKTLVASYSSSFNKKAMPLVSDD